MLLMMNWDSTVCNNEKIGNYFREFFGRCAMHKICVEVNKEKAFAAFNEGDDDVDLILCRSRLIKQQWFPIPAARTPAVFGSHCRFWW